MEHISNLDRIKTLIDIANNHLCSIKKLHTKVETLEKELEKVKWAAFDKLSNMEIRLQALEKKK